MPTLGNALDFAKYEARNIRGHQLGAAPSSPVTGQLYYNTGDNTLYWWDGTAWVSARGGAAATPPATASVLGTIMLAGDLAGTASSPQIAAGVITDVEVAAANKDGADTTQGMRSLGKFAGQALAGNTPLDQVKRPVGYLDMNGFPISNVANPGSASDAATKNYVDTKAPNSHATTHQPGGADAMAVDAAVGTGSLRTLGSGGLQAMPGSRVLSAINAPTASLTLAGQQIVNVADPTGSQDAATKNYVDIQDGVVRGYVDAAVQGMTWKNPVLVVATTPIAGGAAPAGAQTIDGVVLVNSDRVLLTAQTSPQFNGIWQVNTTGSWNRVADANSSAELVNAAVYVSKGTVGADTAWVCTTDAPITVDTTPLAFAQFSGAAQITAGAGLTKTGNSLDVGAGAGITVNADTIQVANDGITNAMIADGAINLATADVTGTLPITKGGTGGNTAALARNALTAAGYYSSTNQLSGATYSIPQSTHGLRASRGLLVQVQDETSGAVELPDVVVAANGDVAVTWGVSQSVNSKRVTIIG